MRLCDALLPEIASHFTTSTGVAASTISWFVIAYGLMQVFFGPLADRWGKLRLVAWTVTLSAVTNLLMVFAGSLDALSMLRAVAGALGAGIIPVGLAYIGDTVDYEQRQQVLAKFMSATISGGIAGQWLGGIYADTLGWEAAFLTLGVLFAVVAVALRRALLAPVQPPGPDHRSFRQQLPGILASRWARLILLVVFIEGALVFSAIVFIPTYLHTRFALPLTAAGGIVALYGVGGLGYTVFARALLGRFGERGLAAGGGLCLGAGFLFLLFGNHWGWAVPACLISGFGFYMLHNTLQANATQMAPHARGTAVALFASCLFMGQSLGIGIMAAGVDTFGARAAFGVCLVALPLLGLWFANRLQYRPA